MSARAVRSRARLRPSWPSASSASARSASGMASATEPRSDSKTLAFQYAAARALGESRRSAFVIALRQVRMAWLESPRMW